MQKVLRKHFSHEIAFPTLTAGNDMSEKYMLIEITCIETLGKPAVGIKTISLVITVDHQ